ncbi:MAG: hypothetical protein QXS69_03440 [Candidatus Aenigmatarchaeota archaeon]
MTSYRDLLEKFLEDETNRKYALPIVKKLLQQRLRSGYYIVKGKIKVKESELENNILNIFEALIDKSVGEDKKYDASLIPTIISIDNAPNFYIGKESPTEEEVYRFLYLIISGIYRGSYIVNLDNVNEKIRDNFRNYLINEKILILPSEKEEGGIDLRKMMNSMGIKVIPYLDKFIYSFILLSSFVVWLRKVYFKKEEWIKKTREIGVPSMLEEIGINEDVTLVVCYLPKHKKEIYFFPRLKSLISKWYGDYLIGKEDSPFMVDFIFSTYVSDKDYRELSSSLLNKFLYYFLNGYVNGELLSKLINLKISYELKKKTKQIYGFSNARRFFSELSRNI